MKILNLWFGIFIIMNKYFEIEIDNKWCFSMPIILFSLFYQVRLSVVSTGIDDSLSYIFNTLISKDELFFDDFFDNLIDYYLGIMHFVFQ